MEKYAKSDFVFIGLYNITRIKFTSHLFRIKFVDKIMQNHRIFNPDYYLKQHLNNSQHWPLFILPCYTYTVGSLYNIFITVAYFVSFKCFMQHKQQ